VVTEIYGWTERLQIPSPGIDPSGIQDAGTRLQVSLLPGLTTVTQNVRYISLLAGARYRRTLAPRNGPPEIEIDQYMRRLEAVIAFCSVLHHESQGDAPPGIVGRRTVDRNQNDADIALHVPNRVPALEIYKGAMRDLELLDLEKNQLRGKGTSVGKSWDLSAAGDIGHAITQGYLPETASRQMLSENSEAFCLCRVPDSSEEQNELISALFGLPEPKARPAFNALDPGEDAGRRVASWRMLLEIIALSPDRNLSGEFLMERLLEPDVLRMTVSSPVRKALLLWRWVAARAFFERGWTQIFSRAFGVLKGQPEGMWSAHLRSEMRDLYPDEQTVESLSQEVKEGICRSGWLTERFRSGNPKDSLLLLIAGLTAAQLDEIEEPDLDISQLGDNGAITVSEESERYKSFSGKICRDFWADTAIKTLLNHFSR